MLRQPLCVVGARAGSKRPPNRYSRWYGCPLIIVTAR